MVSQNHMEALIGALSEKSSSITPMPGYTHMQKAMPTTVGIWFASYRDALLDQMAFLPPLASIIDQSPLGSAA